MRDRLTKRQNKKNEIEFFISNRRRNKRLLDKICFFFLEYGNTVCPRSSYPSYTVSYYITWVTNSWTYSKYGRRCGFDHQKMKGIKRFFFLSETVQSKPPFLEQMSFLWLTEDIQYGTRKSREILFIKYQVCRQFLLTFNFEWYTWVITNGFRKIIDLKKAYNIIWFLYPDCDF